MLLLYLLRFLVYSPCLDDQYDEEEDYNCGKGDADDYVQSIETSANADQPPMQASKGSHSWQDGEEISIPNRTQVRRHSSQSLVFEAHSSHFGQDSEDEQQNSNEELS